MTYKELQDIIKDNNIPDDVNLMNNSGWECCVTEINGVYYSRLANEIHFTRDSDYISGEEYTREDIGSKSGHNRTDWVVLK